MEGIEGFENLDKREQKLIKCIKQLSETTNAIAYIMENYFDMTGVKKEYQTEKYNELVVIDEILKNNLEAINLDFQELKEEKEFGKTVNFILIVGEEVENLMQECSDFSILFYTLVVDIMLLNSGMPQNLLPQDTKDIIQKYYTLVEKLDKYKDKLTTFLNCYYD